MPQLARIAHPTEGILTRSAQLVGGVKELARIGAGGDPVEGEMGISVVTGGSRVALPVDGVAVPGPQDDRLLLIPGEQVAPALPVAIPQLSPARDAADGPPDDPVHHRA